ncbi:MAG: hypothetical protein NTX14_04430 [Candidatus Nealsonbacteria bacterium]|nr:hypothetical protein [Candidatus Nealsonbacteria bacterium]
MESGYRQISLMVFEGVIEVDGVLKKAMNATLAIMLAVESGELDPCNIAEHEFLHFERSKKATLDWLFARFVMWYSDCYPLQEEYSALDYFMESIRYDSASGAERDSEIRNILHAIAIEMSERRKKRSQPKSGLVKDSVICVRQALSIEGAFIFFDQSY